MPKRRLIDLRSDTVTHPTEGMRKAMATAAVGDDVMGEDPTVNALEAAAANRVVKEAAVFMPSGTMVNQAAIWVHSGRQGAIACEEGSHCYTYEGGAPALLSNVLVRPIRGVRGVFTSDDVAATVPPGDAHYAPLRLVVIENTHNRAGGTVWTPAQTSEVADACHDRGIPMHLDGARIFNSAVAQGVPVTRLTGPADSVGFCLSKGLSAPVGSLLCGSREFIGKARRVRKVLGGGMRQAGVLAAAGLVALDEMVDRLGDDHANARVLADGLVKVPGIGLDMATVQTNIVIFDVKGTGLSPRGFCDAMKAEGVLCSPRDWGHAVRMVTHRMVTRADVEHAVKAVHAVVKRRARVVA